MKSWIFSYGSLVNEKTDRVGGESLLAVLDGWRRAWSHPIELPEGPIWGLTITESPGTNLHGRLIAVEDADFEALDKREVGYRRFLLQSDVRAVGPVPRDGVNLNNRIYAYRSAEEIASESPTRRILQTYLDCVLDGYFRNFGEAGAVEFIRTTKRWDREIWNDRDRPVYPRALDLDADFLRWVDGTIERFRS